MLNHGTRKTHAFTLRGSDTLEGLVADILEHDLHQALKDGNSRSLIITIHPDNIRKH